MILTAEQITQNNHIPTELIEVDINDTQREIDQYNKELSVLNNDPVKNRLAIYMVEGNIIQRKEFIDHMTQILNYRRIHDTTR